jgi:hypothetical protein
MVLLTAREAANEVEPLPPRCAARQPGDHARVRVQVEILAGFACADPWVARADVDHRPSGCAGNQHPGHEPSPADLVPRAGKQPIGDDAEQGEAAERDQHDDQRGNGQNAPQAHAGQRTE